MNSKCVCYILEWGELIVLTINFFLIIPEIQPARSSRRLLSRNDCNQGRLRESSQTESGSVSALRCDDQIWNFFFAFWYISIWGAWMQFHFYYTWTIAGNTRVVGQEQLQKFQENLGKALKDPFQVVMRQTKLPISLLSETAKVSYGVRWVTYLLQSVCYIKLLYFK